MPSSNVEISNHTCFYFYQTLIIIYYIHVFASLLWKFRRPDGNYSNTKAGFHLLCFTSWLVCEEVFIGQIENIVWSSDQNLIIIHYVSLCLTSLLACGGNFIGQSGQITSPGWPLNYPDNQNCLYVITVPEPNTVLLNITDFHLEDEEDCDYDYLEVRSLFYIHPEGTKIYYMYIYTTSSLSHHGEECSNV